MQKWLILSCCVFAVSLHARKTPFHEFILESEVEAPWLTGPLLSPSSTTIPLGHVNFEPYFFAVANTGVYKRDWESVKTETLWQNSFQPFIQAGLASVMDFSLLPTLFYDYANGAAKWGAGDMTAFFGFQLYNSGGKVTDWIITVKLFLKEVFPIGKHKNLDFKKKGTDAIGQGSWQTGLGLVWGNLFYLGKHHFWSVRFSLGYTWLAPLHVKNLNVYGGDAGTDGTAYPGQNLQFDIGSEISLSQNWVFALDIYGTFSNKSRFKGQTFVPSTLPASAQFSLAPAIEYNWNANLGIIFGPWFTVAGCNAPQFTSGVFAINYYH